MGNTLVSIVAMLAALSGAAAEEKPIVYGGLSMKRFWIVAFLLVSVLSVVYASEFRMPSKIPIETVASRSHLGAVIVVGEALSVSNHGREVRIPWTTYDVKVSEVLWGDAPDVPIRLSFPGGLSADGKDLITISGLPGVIPNSRMFAFLVRRGSSYQFYDWFRGQYDITTVEGEEGLVIHTGRRDLLPERIRTKLPEGDEPVSVHVTLTELRAFLAALEDKPQPEKLQLPPPSSREYYEMIRKREQRRKRR